MSGGLSMSDGQQAAVAMSGRQLPRRHGPAVVQDLSGGLCMSGEHSDSGGMSSRQLLSIGHRVRLSVLVSERHLRRPARSAISRRMHAMYSRSILRLSGSDGAYWFMQVRILLRRRQSGIDATLQRGVSVPRELCGRDMFVGEEHDVERRVSSGPLLSHGQRITGSMSSGHELDI